MLNILQSMTQKFKRYSSHGGQCNTPSGFITSHGRWNSIKPLTHRKRVKGFA